MGVEGKTADASETESPALVVLVVDDDPDVRKLASIWLETEDIECLQARDPQEAIELLDDHGNRIGTVLFDVMMPRMDGYAFLKWLREQAQYRDIPVVFISGSATTEKDVVRGIEYGADDHIPKPFSGPILVARVRALLERRRSQLALTEELERTRELATTDPLTGLVNRRSFEVELERHASYTQRHDEPFSLLMADVDHFKHINDCYGHLEGDNVLRELTQRMTEALRREDQAFRLGGEEFGIILRGTDLAAGLRAAERLVAAVRDEPFALVSGGSIRVTLSVGVAAADGSNGFLLDDLQVRADRALYAAKHAGRDRVVSEAELQD